MLTYSLNDAAGAQGPRPFTQDGCTYQLLDTAGKPLGTYPALPLALEAIAAWPRRTLFLLTQWRLAGGSLAFQARWMISLGFDNKYRQTPINRHWTIKPESGKN